MGRRWVVLLSTSAIVMVASAANAQDDIDLDDLLGDIPIWDQIYTVRLGAGYSDNLLLSDINPESSSMVLGGLDITLFRLPVDGNQVTFFASLDARWYPEGEEISDESSALAVLEAKHDFGEFWQGGISGQYFYQDQVVDASVTEVDVSTVQVRGNRVELSTPWQLRFAGRHWLEPLMSGARQWFAGDVLDDYWQFGGGLGYGLDYGHRSDIRLTYRTEDRRYDTREQYTSGGVPISGTRLRYRYREAELAWRHHFDADRHWRLNTRFGYGRNEDNGTGYFDFRRYYTALQVRFQRDRWELRVEGRLSFYDYDQQPSDEEPGDTRRRTAVTVGVRGERELGRWVTVFGEYEFEDTSGNVSYDVYTLNRVSAGIDLEF